MNAVQYHKILEGSLLGTLSNYNLQPSNIVFQQDGDPKHTSHLAYNWFHDHDIKILRWALSSPDMNIIEHAWDQLDRQLRLCSVLPKNADELWVILQEEWTNCDMDYINKLYNSMPRRVRALYDMEGGYTKY
jgi:hypothetical protein